MAMNASAGTDDVVPAGDGNARRLRVLFVTRKWPPAVGGMEIYSAELASALNRRALIDVIKLHGKNDGRPPSAANLAIFTLSTSWKIVRTHKKYDAILIGDLVLSPLAILLRLFGHSGGVFIAAHGRDIGFIKQRTMLSHIYRPYIKSIVRAQAAITSVIANSNATAERCRKAGFKRVEVVPLGVRPLAAPKIVENPDRYVLFVGRVIPMKGVGWFINNVLPLLPPDIRLKVAGTIWDNVENSYIKSCQRVDFIGPLFGAELASMRANSIAVIAPNIEYNDLEFEGFGLSALEAAAQGGVVVAANLHGLRDAIIDGKTGFLLPPENPHLWADKIRDISLWSDKFRKSFIRNSIESVHDYYSWDRVACDYIKIINNQKDPPN